MLKPRTNILADDPKTMEAPEKKKKLNFSPCSVHCLSFRVLWLKSNNQMKIHIVSHRFIKGIGWA